MKHHFFRVAIVLPLFGLFLASCKKPVSSCIQVLQQRDASLDERVDSLMLHRGELTIASYRTALEQLYTEEIQLFREVASCDFGKDLEAYNYWYRGRLKFPGKIEQELKRLKRDSVGK